MAAANRPTRQAKRRPAALRKTNSAIQKTALETPHPKAASALHSDAIAAYQRDIWERSILFSDTLRRRADNMLVQKRAGLPPVLYGNCQAGWAATLPSAACRDAFRTAPDCFAQGTAPHGATIFEFGD